MKPFAWILTLVAFCLGCNLIDNGVQTLVIEPYQYCAHEDEHRAHVHHEQLAREAWGDFCTANPTQNFSKDFSCGFIDGFADYLDAGGTCEPPPVPPREYWDQRNCRQASIDWSGGFRTGAQLARQTGLRQCVVVPTGTCVDGGAVHVYCAPCQHESPTMEVVPLPASTPSETYKDGSVPGPNTMPAAPQPPQATPGVTAAPSVAPLPTAPFPPQLTPKNESASAPPLAAPAVSSAQDASVEVLPATPCFFNDSIPSFPEDVNPFSSNDISGCAYESR